MNMMENIGFDSSATHTESEAGFEAALKASSLPMPLTYPDKVSQDIDADNYVSKNVFKIKSRSLLSKLNRWRKGEPYAWV